MMDDVPVMKRRFLVVMDNAVAREDVCELLASHFRAEVDERWSLSENWGDGYAAAFFDMSIEELAADPRIRDLKRGAVPIIVVDGHIPAESYAKVGLNVLVQPFRSSDVVALLGQLGVRDLAPR